MILPSLANTGPGIVVQELCTGLINNGQECKVFYFDNVVELKMPCPVEKISIFKAFDFNDWDIVHSHMFRPDFYVWFHTLLRKYSFPHFISTLHNPVNYRALHTNYNCIFSLLGSLLWPFFLKAFNLVVVLNKEIYQTIQRVSKSKLRIVYNGRNISLKSYITNEKDDFLISSLRKEYIIIGTISGVNKRKGLEQMLKALINLPEYAFVVVGDGPELENLKCLAKQYGVEHRCCWIGYRPYAVDYNVLFDIFVMCTRSEGFPLALVEAAAYGKPTVLSNIPILTSLITSKEVVFFELDNIDSLVSAIYKVTYDKVKYSINIRKYYESCLTLEKMVENYLSLYEEIILSRV